MERKVVSQVSFMDGDKVVTVQPQGRFKADNALVLSAPAAARLGIACLPDCITHEYVVSGAPVPVMIRYPPLIATQRDVSQG